MRAVYVFAVALAASLSAQLMPWTCHEHPRPGTNLWLLIAGVGIMLIADRATHHWTLRAGLGLVAGGVASNVIELSMTGSASNYLEIGQVLFNVADLCIWVGVVLLFIGATVTFSRHSKSKSIMLRRQPADRA